MNKIYSMLGLCIKAGKLAYGSDMVINNIKKKKVKLIILSEDASENTKKKFIELANENNLKIIIFGKKEDLNQKIGEENKVVFGVLDENFSKSIIKLFEDLKGAII